MFIKLNLVNRILVILCLFVSFLPTLSFSLTLDSSNNYRVSTLVEKSEISKILNLSTATINYSVYEIRYTNHIYKIFRDNNTCENGICLNYILREINNHLYLIGHMNLGQNVSTSNFFPFKNYQYPKPIMAVSFFTADNKSTEIKTLVFTSLGIKF
jgi:hypothetical protein